MKRLLIPYIQDPGHGWIKVPIKDVERLGVKPSEYSFKCKYWAFLEEDYDAPLFLRAKEKAGEEYQLEVRHREKVAIRSYPRFPA